jgi:hypothetical protein
MTDDLREHIASLNIQEIRLLNGDHILAEVLYDHESDDIVIKDPVQLTIGPTGGRVFSEWFGFTDGQYFSIDKSSIIASGNLDFQTKAFFCRLVLTRSIKTNILSGNPQDPEDLELLKEIALIMGSDVLVSKEDNELADQQVEELYSNWADEVDGSIVH